MFRSPSTDYPRPIAERGTHSADTFQSLSYRFSLRSSNAELGRAARTLISDFAKPVRDHDPGSTDSVVYSFRDGPSIDGKLRYALYRNEQQVAVGDDRAVLVSQLLWHISGDTVELAEGYLLIHAGVVATPTGEGVAILGESGSGKTTLVAALVQEGFGYLSDEAAAISLDTGLVHPWPRPLGFRAESRALARFAPLFPPGNEKANEMHVPIGHIRPGAIAGPVHVRSVIDHCYTPGAATRLDPLSRGLALVRMGSAAPRLRREGGRGLDVLAYVMHGARAHSLVSGDLEQSVRAVRECVDQ